MILKDGKHIQGIFKYVPDVRYEVGDFVIEGDCIYVCKKELEDNELDTLPSANSNAFSPYPGSLITSLNEYEEYLESPNGKEDKYISSNILLGILQGMYFGFGDTGVINSYIVTSGDHVNMDTELQSLLGKVNSVSSKPLDLLMRESSINNAYVQVSRDLLDTKYLVYTGGGDNCLLRQYTYRDLNNLNQGKRRYRIQELVDFENGVTYYRYTYGTRGANLLKKSLAWKYNTKISDWTCTTISPALLQKMNEIINYYNREQQMQESTHTGFNFRNLILPEGTTNKCTLFLSNYEDILESSGSDYPVITPINDFEEESFLITINTKSLSIGNIYKTNTVTIDTRDTANKPGGDTLDYYYLDNNLKLEVKYIKGENPNIELSILGTNGKISTDATILSIYYRSNGN